MSNARSYFVYILANQRRTTYYIGVTNDLRRRLHEHKNHIIPGLTSQYNCSKIVYYEETSDVDAAIAREKQLKKWSRKKKLELIQRVNPNIRDLSTSLEMTQR